MRLRSVLPAAVLLLASGCARDPVALRPLPTAERDALVAALRAHGTPPDDYVLSRLRANRVVLLGEMHRIRHDVVFVRELLPRLREAGVSDVGMEFYCAVDQPQLDEVVTAPAFDEAAARELLRHNTGGTWAYREYLDLLRAAWRVNRERGPGVPPLRVIGLGPDIDYAKRADGTDEEKEREREKGRRYDAIMAGALTREVLDRGRKALVYCGIHHAFSGYVQLHRGDDGKPVGRDRCGNLLARAFPDSVETIYLHAPWFTRGEPIRFLLPCGGAFDQAFREYGRPVGFTLAATPFAALRDRDCAYAYGYDRFTAGDYADGWILLEPIDRFEGVHVIDDWVESPEMFERLRLSIPNRRWAETLTSPEEYLHGLARDAELERIYAEPIAAYRGWAGSSGT